MEGIGTYLRQINIRNNHLIQRTRRIPLPLTRVPTRMILVPRIIARLPGLRVLDARDGVLRRGRGGVAREVPAREREGACHDREEDLPER
jgi:hypothetical protein